MITLRQFQSSDQAEIQNWPAYPTEFAELDYALREQGWLDEFHGKPNTRIYIAEQAGKIIAFSLLAKKGISEAEFRIALRADIIGQGMGNIITTMTLNEGFSSLGLTRISLIVRKNNAHALRLYQKIGFSVCGECTKITNEKPVCFFEMYISRPANSR